MKNGLNLQSRSFLRSFAAATAGSILPAFTFVIAAGEAAGERPMFVPKQLGGGAVHDVLPAIGTGWRGHMFPGAVAPFWLVQLSPDTSGPPNRMRNGQRDNYTWDHSSGYHYNDNVVVGLSHTHVQGTGGIDLGDILVMPE